MVVMYVGVIVVVVVVVEYGGTVVVIVGSVDVGIFVGGVIVVVGC